MVDHLRHGREAYARRAWHDAYQAFLRADEATPLDADDLERLATAAYLVGHEAEFQREKLLGHLKLDSLRLIGVRVGTMLNQPTGETGARVLQRQIVHAFHHGANSPAARAEQTKREFAVRFHQAKKFIPWHEQNL